MSVYCISDVHGALRELQRLLHRIGFRYDGSDELYLLGDYGDWGQRSMETILFVREMDRRWPFVHTAMGNHELMFLQAIRLVRELPPDSILLREHMENWLVANRGSVTWESYLSLPEEDREDLAGWLADLRLSYDVEAGGRSYHLAHAYPYFYDMPCPAEEDMRRRQDAVWRRLMLREDPFEGYAGGRHYDMFVCGHTITDYYFARLRYEHDWPLRKPQEHVRNRVFRAEKFVDIDCGAKCMDLQADGGDIFQIAALRAQLCAMRLDDGHAFYCRRRLNTAQVLQASGRKG